jgi:integrase
MATGRITAETVNALGPGTRDYFLWDDKLAGFGIKVTPAGRKIYVLQYRMGGAGHKTKRYTIGAEGSPWRPESARKRATTLLTAVKHGEDIGAKAKEDLRIATDLAFQTYAERFADTKLKADWPKSWKQTKGCITLHASAHWKDKPLPSITRSDVTKLLAKLDDKPATRRNLYSALSYLFGQAVKADDISASPMDGIDAPPMVAARDFTLDRDELRWLWASTTELSAPYDRILRLLVLLGQRRSETAGMTWDELNRKNAEWHIPASRAKNKCETIVPLPASAVSMLDDIAGKEQWPRHGLVFPSGANSVVSGFSKVKATLDRAMSRLAKAEEGKVRDWRLHDLRRTLATNLQALAVPYEVVEHLLNHKERTRTGIGKVYQTHGFKAEKRAAIERWQDELARIVEGETRTVIPMRRPA